MAIEKILNTRIALKYDLLENWEKSTLALKKGEIAIAVVNPTEENGLKEAVTMIKIGEDGVKTFNDLSWNFYAKASDVIAEAKSAETLEAFVANVIANSGIASDEAMEALSERVADAEDAIEVLNGAADEEGSVAKAIADAIAALDLANTYAAKEHTHEMDEVNGLSDAIADAKKAGTDASAALEAYKTTNDAAVAKVAEDLAAEVEAARAAEKANADAIAAMCPEDAHYKNFKDVEDDIDNLYAGILFNTEEDFVFNTESKRVVPAINEVHDEVDAIKNGEAINNFANVELALNNLMNGIIGDANDLQVGKTLISSVNEINDEIDAIKDHDTVDSFADVMAEVAKKQDIIPENTYDAYGAAAQALTDANAYTEEVVEELAEAIGAALGEIPDNKTVLGLILETYDRTTVNASAIDAINNAETGILKQAKDYADGKDEAIADAKKAGTDAMAEAQAKVASVTAADNSVTVAGTATAPTVAAKLSADADNALTLAEDGLKVVIPAAAEYSIVKAADSGDYAAVYNLTKDGAIVGASINIPKDMVVKSGSVVGDEIVLVLNDEASTEIKIPVASLIEYVTSGSVAGDMVVVNVSDDHKVTATITDGTVTLAKLTTEVQTAIGKAHSHENADVINAITADDVANWNGAQAAAEATAAGALAAAKSELDGKITAAEGDIDKLERIIGDFGDGEVTIAQTFEFIEKVFEDDMAQKSDLTALEGRVTTAEGEIDALQEKVDTGDQKVSEYVAAAVEALKIGDYAKAAELTALAERVTAAEERFTTVETDIWGNQMDIATLFERCDIKEGETVSGLVDAVSQRVTAVEEKAHVHTNAAELDKFVDGDKAKLDTAVQTVTAGDGLTATKTGTEVAIAFDDTITFIFDCGTSDESYRAPINAEGVTF